jgi:hypothetical protein
MLKNPIVRPEELVGLSQLGNPVGVVTGPLRAIDHSREGVEEHHIIIGFIDLAECVEMRRWTVWVCGHVPLQSTGVTSLNRARMSMLLLSIEAPGERCPRQ